MLVEVDRPAASPATHGPGPARPTARQLLLIAAGLVASAAAGWLHVTESGPITTFLVSTVALALLAAIVGMATEHLGSVLGPGATGVVQAGLGNLPELFVSIFALRQGLDTVVRFSLIGSILSNSLLVLGLAFIGGGLRHGTLKFHSGAPRMIATLLLLAVAALAVPSLAAELHTPAGGHDEVLSVFCAAVLVIVFLTTIPGTLREERAVEDEAEAGSVWPLWTTLLVLALAGVAAAFVSDWFTEALKPAIETLGISQAFAGLVIVAIAGNAVEHVAGIQLAMRGKADYAVSIILNSSLQVAVVVVPAVVLASWFVTGAVFTLVLPSLLLAAVFFAAMLGAVIVFDGRGDVVEGAALIGLYGILAAAFWWG